MDNNKINNDDIINKELQENAQEEKAEVQEKAQEEAQEEKTEAQEDAQEEKAEVQEEVQEEAQEGKAEVQEEVQEEAQEEKTEVQEDAQEEKAEVQEEVQEEAQEEKTEVQEEVQEEKTEAQEEVQEEAQEETQEEIEDISQTTEIDVNSIKIEEIDLDEVKKELEKEFEKKEYDKERLRQELEILEQNILKQNDVFETDIILGALLKEQDLLNQTMIINKGNESNVSGQKNVSNMSNVEVTSLKPKKKKTYNKAMSKVLVAVASVFMVLILYIVYYVMFDSKTKLNNEYNERSLLLEETVVRGNIYSDDGKVLAQTIKEDDKWIRHYPYGSLFAHTVGRYEKGKTGIELANDFTLVTTKDTTIDKIVNDINNEKSNGNGIVTTLNYDLQKIAYDALGKNKGAIVAIEPQTGKILAMVSKPSYDPNYISKNWSVLANSENNRNSLMNKATNGLYPPGSTFKIVTSIAYMRNENVGKYEFNCTGVKNFNGYNLSCYDKTAHGKLDIVSAFSMSCNGAYGQMGVKIGASTLRNVAEKFYFNKDFKYDYGYTKSSITLSNSDDETMVAQSSIGQGNTKITPLHNALIASTVANEGIMMRPYLVDRIVDGDGDPITQNRARILKRVMSKKESDILKEMMRSVAVDGTAYDLSSLNIKVGGKTGSAEYDDKGNSHAWFVGFAPFDNPQIAISIIVENGGTSSSTAVPIAKRIFSNFIE